MLTCATRPGPKKLFTGKGSIDELIDNDKFTRGRVAFSEPQAERKDLCNARPFQGIDIRPIIEVGGRNSVAAPTRQKHHRDPIKLTKA